MLTEPIMLFNGFVESASLNAGYGLNGSTCQLSLVYKEDGPNRPADVNPDGSWLNYFESNFPPLGTAIGFKVGECEFVGLFQRYVNKRSLSGYKWDIVLESPAKLLDGVQVILGEFQGTAYTGANPYNPSSDIQFTTQIENVWNPFAIMENYENGGILGGSDANSLGFPVMDNGSRKGLLTLLEEISRGEHPYGGSMKFGVTEFTLDLSELAGAINKLSESSPFQNSSLLRPDPKYLRIRGPVQSLGAIIQELSDLIMYDFIVVLEPREGSIQNGIIPEVVLKVKMVDKSAPPDPNVVKNMVDGYEREQRLVNADVGKELSDAVTQKLVIGGPATRYYVSNVMIPIWGKTRSLVPQYTTNIVLDDGSFYTPDLLEVRCAMSSKETWILYHLIQRYRGQSNPFVGSLGNALFSHVRINDYVLGRIFAGEVQINDLIDTSLNTSLARGEIYNGVDPRAQVDRLYNAIAESANHYYGRMYFVPIPMEPGGLPNNIKYVREDQNYITSWEIADSAWYASTEGGLSEDPGIRDVSFYDDSGKLKATATWVYDPFRADYSQLGDNYTFSVRGIASVIDVERNIYWINNQAYAVVTIPAVNYIDDLTTDVNGLYKLLRLMLNAPEASLKNIANIGASNGPLTYGITRDRINPIYIGIPQISTRYRWGPWWGWNSKLGKAEVILEDSLTPETYGGMVQANEVGFSYASVENAEIAGVESGFVEVAELPIGTIGNRFAVSGPYVTSMDINLSISAITTNYKFNTWTPQFGKLAKYNIDRIANINKSFIKILQAQRDLIRKPILFTPTFQEMKFTGDMPNNNSMFGGGGILAASLNTNGGNQILNVSNQAAGDMLGPMFNDPENVYGNSSEQIWTPIEIAKQLPSSQTRAQFLQPDEVDSEGDFEGGHVGPTSKELDPYFGNTENDFQLVASSNANGLPESMNLKEVGMDSITKVRPMALRGPLLLSGWGYDLTDKLTPEENEIALRSKWKTGPIDLKWDDERKVWGSGFHIIEGVLTGSITAPSTTSNKTTFEIEIRRDDWDDRGEVVTVVNRDPTLELEWESSYANKILVIAIRINYEWRPLWVGCPDNL